MKTSIKVVLAVAVVIALAGAYQFPQVKEAVNLGANPGPDFYNNLTFHQNFTKGGTQVATSSTAATYTLTSKEIRKDVSYVSWTPNVNTTLTTMASTSAPLIDLKKGESFDLYFYNASSTAAATVTFAAGTGVDLQKNEDTADLAVNGLDVVKLTFIKKANTDIIVTMEEFIEAD